jgi:hypothetical protein
VKPADTAGRCFVEVLIWFPVNEKMNPLFLLMNKDDEIAKIEMISSNGIEEYQYVEKSG